jgi:hypothetical protein
MAKGIKTGGRQKGTSNKLSGTVKEMITQFVTNEIQHLPSILSMLEPREKADYIIKLLPYILPKKAPIEEPKEPSRPMRIHDMFKAEMAQNEKMKQG